MKQFLNSPWPLLLVMMLGTTVALATSASFIAQSEDPLQEQPQSSPNHSASR